MWPYIATEYFRDAELALLNGAFLSCINDCLRVCEDLLKLPRRIERNEKMMELVVEDLITSAAKDGSISNGLAENLLEICETRTWMQRDHDLWRIESSGIPVLELRAKSAFSTIHKLTREFRWIVENREQLPRNLSSSEESLTRRFLRHS